MVNKGVYDFKEWDKVFDTLIKNKNEIVDKLNDYLLFYFKNSFNIKSWDGIKWKPSRMNVDTLVDTGKLKKSIHTVSKSLTEIHIQSNTPYSAIHNYGGEIRITEKMRRFFWAKYNETKNSAWKNMALTRKSHITIPKRTYMGETQEMIDNIEKIILDTITPNKKNR